MSSLKYGGEAGGGGDSSDCTDVHRFFDDDGGVAGSRCTPAASGEAMPAALVLGGVDGRRGCEGKRRRG